MKYKTLGRSGLRVSEICFGAMGFGEEWTWGASKEESKKLYDTFINAGGNFIDTANKYTDGTSEKYLGEFIKSEREKIVLASKYTLTTNPKEPTASGNSRKNMMQALGASLKRLGTDYIDLYYVHAWDLLTPADEIMRALDDAIRMGKILYIGVSDTPAWMAAKANTMAELRGWAQFAALQIEYSLVERTVENDLIPMAKDYCMSVVAWAPLARGVLSGKYSSGRSKEEKSRLKDDSPMLSKENMMIADEVIRVAEEIGCKPSHVALKWLMQKNKSVIPIVGVTKLYQLEENLGALECELNAEQMSRLDNISEPELIFPHRFLKSEIVRNLLYGDNKP
jgi:aryl-alcohol dehydrogenase-like predicted oxidoreductase